jgi:HSP20 family molecular chaperone IbpA
MSETKDPAVWMWAQACELIDQADRLHRQFFRPTASARAFAVWEPPIDVFEDGHEVVIVVAMPGVPADRVEVKLEGGTIVVRGERPVSLRRQGYAVRRLEIPYGGFERRIALPSGRFEVSPPQLAQGCLVLSLRKLEREVR